MNWIDNFVRPKIRSFLSNKRETPENLWVKDPESGEMVFYRDLEANQWVVPNSGYHMKIK
ncbi:MAG TPA: acetyl-CoA carboxylase carboxyl transferase subunit beta, partial [Devosia sp.]|nr:acetyl-CoA carboxylase carboxyl transferase subunit beta [Devosia sp.]